jgi:PAS domain S-box-containing protein
MKQKIIPTGKEIALDSHEFIVSKTDVRGRISYVNREFMRISGFSETELLGNQHNIIRHPDMPRVIFNKLWETIATGQECFAYVKNLCKNGDHYWVLANITPDFNSRDEIVGFFSIRRRPEEHAVEFYSQLYSRLLLAEKKAGTRGAIAASTALLNQIITEKGFERYETFVLGSQA